MKRIIFSIVCLILTSALQAQFKRDTVMFTLHCPENKIEVEENLQSQLDSIYEKLGFLDSTKVTLIYQAIVVGFTDSKGTKKTNVSLSEQRARYVQRHINNYRAASHDIVLGLGEAQPIADNKTAEGRAKNRRVEVTLVYGQRNLPQPAHVPKKVYPDTIIVFEDGTMLQINLADYHSIKHCLKYERSTSLFDLFEDLAEYNNDETYYNFGKISLTWCNAPCLKNNILLSIRVPDSLIKSSLKDLKAYVRRLKKQRVKLTKHKDERWYIDVDSYCAVGMPPCVIGCGRNNGTNEKIKIKKVRIVAKDGYRIIGASTSNGESFNYKKESIAKRKIKLKIRCLPYYPTVSVVTIRKGNADTIYYASGTEHTIAHGWRCASCKQKKKKDKSLSKAAAKNATQKQDATQVKEKKEKNRFLRRKYKFRKQDYTQKMARKIVKSPKS